MHRAGLLTEWSSCVYVFFYNVNTFSFKFQQLRKQWVDRSDNISEENDEICKIRENLLVHVVSWLFQIVIILIIILIIIFYIFMSMCLPLDAYVIIAVVLWQKNIISPLVGYVVRESCLTEQRSSYWIPQERAVQSVLHIVYIGWPKNTMPLYWIINK